MWINFNILKSLWSRTCHRTFSELSFEPDIVPYLPVNYVLYLIVRFWGARCDKEICNPNPCKDTLSYGLQSKMMLKMNSRRQQVENKLNTTRMENDYVCKPYSQEQRSKDDKKTAFECMLVISDQEQVWYRDENSDILPYLCLNSLASVSKK